jgi:hypothetical protein
VIRIYHRCNEKKKCKIRRHHNGDQKIAMELSEEPIVKIKRRERDNQKIPKGAISRYHKHNKTIPKVLSK